MANAHKSLGELFSAIADAIRAKTGGTAQIVADSFPDAISAISAGTDTSDATADAADVKQGKTFYAGGEKKTGSMAEAEPTYIFDPPTIENSGLLTYGVNLTEGYTAGGAHTSTHQLDTFSGMTITPGATKKGAATAGKYVLGDIWVEGDANLVPANIKQGVSIFGVSGSLSGMDSGTFTGDGSATMSVATSIAGPNKLVIVRESAPNYMYPGLMSLTYRDGTQRTVYVSGADSDVLTTKTNGLETWGASGGTLSATLAYGKFANNATYHWAAWT